VRGIGKEKEREREREGVQMVRLRYDGDKQGSSGEVVSGDRARCMKYQR
jgi:hypothetical protein